MKEIRIEKVRFEKFDVLKLGDIFFNEDGEELYMVIEECGNRMETYNAVDMSTGYLVHFSSDERIIKSDCLITANYTVEV